MNNDINPVYVPVSRTPIGTSWPWVIVIIVLIIVIIALVIWLIIRFNNSSGGGNGRLVAIPGASITSSSGSVSGSWTTLNSEQDKVTLYVSTTPLVFNSNGTVVCNNTNNCTPASAVGSNNKVSVNVTTGMMYSAALVVTGPDTNHYAIYGPKNVFAQETADLDGILFNIKDLNNVSGSVSNTGTYTESSNDIGIFRYGSSNASTNTDSQYFLVKYNKEDDTTYTETNLILCRLATGGNPLNTTVKLAEWNQDTPIKIYLQGSTNPDDPANQIQLSSCQWSYNDSPPPGADGLNAWCLRSQQTTSATNTATKITTCMSRNGNVLDIVAPSSTSTTWYNQKIADLPPPV